MSDLLTRYKALQVKSIRVTSAIENHMGVVKDLKIQYGELKAKLDSGVKSVTVQDSAITVIKELIDQLSRNHINEITNLITYALQAIFWDKDYSMEIIITEKRGVKVAEFYLIEKKDGEVLRTAVDDSVGGGIQVIIGFVLQLFYIQYYKLAPVMFLDESFSQLSDIYIPNLKTFIGELASSFDFIFVLVTHDSRLVSGCVTAYQVVNGEVTRISESVAKKVVGAGEKT